MNKKLYELTDGSGEIFETRVMDFWDLSVAQDVAAKETDGNLKWIPGVQICRCWECSTIYNGNFHGFPCPQCGSFEVDTDVSFGDVFTPWEGASQAGNEEAAEEMYEGLRNGRTY